MFLLDTVSVSELRKLAKGLADPNVAAWTRKQTPSDWYISVLTIFELERGVLDLERRDVLQGAVLRTWLNRSVIPTFAGRTLNVDSRIASRCAKLMVPNRRAFADSFIAATAYVHGMVVVTRNVRDFEAAGVPVVNPWDFRTPPSAPA